MIKLDISKATPFLSAEAVAYLEPQVKAAQQALEAGTCAGNDFLGWKHLPSETLNSTLVADCEAIRDAWKAKNIDPAMIRLYVRGDQNAPWERSATVIRCGAAAGLSNVVFGTLPAN